jgi:hypothetical protein
MTALRARDILERLSARHRRDLVFPEVKDGPTWGAAPMRIDLVAIAKSWSPVRISGYEIKVSRSDWLADDKWMAYTRLCHRFSIAAPKGIVLPTEIPPGIGLVEATARGLRTVLKPVHTDPDPDATVLMLLYLLMFRTVPGDPLSLAARSREDRIEVWRSRLAEKDAARRVGYAVASKLRERLRELESAGKNAIANGDAMQEVERWLIEVGADRWGNLRARLDSALALRESQMESAGRSLLGAAERACALLERYKTVHEAGAV